MDGQLISRHVGIVGVFAGLFAAPEVGPRPVEITVRPVDSTRGSGGSTERPDRLGTG
jgi:hypothetical protein